MKESILWIGDIKNIKKNEKGLEIGREEIVNEFV